MRDFYLGICCSEDLFYNDIDLLTYYFYLIYYLIVFYYNIIDIYINNIDIFIL
jgi:hypothetical protein